MRLIVFAVFGFAFWRKSLCINAESTTAEPTIECNQGFTATVSGGEIHSTTFSISLAFFEGHQDAFFVGCFDGVYAPEVQFSVMTDLSAWETSTVENAEHLCGEGISEAAVIQLREPSYAFTSFHLWSYIDHDYNGTETSFEFGVEYVCINHTVDETPAPTKPPIVDMGSIDCNEGVVGDTGVGLTTSTSVALSSGYLLGKADAMLVGCYNGVSSTDVQFEIVVAGYVWQTSRVEYVPHLCGEDTPYAAYIQLDEAPVDLNLSAVDLLAYVDPDYNGTESSIAFGIEYLCINHSADTSPSPDKGPVSSDNSKTGSNAWWVSLIVVGVVGIVAAAAYIVYRQQRKTADAEDYLLNNDNSAL